MRQGLPLTHLLRYFDILYCDRVITQLDQSPSFKMKIAILKDSGANSVQIQMREIRKLKLDDEDRAILKEAEKGYGSLIATTDFVYSQIRLKTALLANEKKEDEALNFIMSGTLGIVTIVHLLQAPDGIQLCTKLIEHAAHKIRRDAYGNMTGVDGRENQRIINLATAMKSWGLTARGHEQVTTRAYQERTLNLGGTLVCGWLDGHQINMQLYGLSQVDTWDLWRYFILFSIQQIVSTVLEMNPISLGITDKIETSSEVQIQIWKIVNQHRAKISAIANREPQVEENKDEDMDIPLEDIAAVLSQSVQTQTEPRQGVEIVQTQTDPEYTQRSRKRTREQMVLENQLRYFDPLGRAVDDLQPQRRQYVQDEDLLRQASIIKQRQKEYLDSLQKEQQQSQRVSQNNIDDDSLDLESEKRLKREAIQKDPTLFQVNAPFVAEQIQQQLNEFDILAENLPGPEGPTPE